MYLLRFLQNGGKGAIGVEYRLVCSGELYNGRLITADYRKSDAGRVLLQSPLELFVVGRPFHRYPQELCARLTLDLTEEPERASLTDASGGVILLPDEDVIEDICSILSLLSRRLISPVGKTREQHPSHTDSLSHEALGSYASDFPAPITQLPPTTAWKARPLTVITRREGQEVINNNPPPVAVDPWRLSEFLLRLPAIHKADQVIYASRL